MEPVLKDVTAGSASSSAEPGKSAAAADPAAASATTIDVADKDAADLGRTLLEMGVTKDHINSIMDAPKALESIRYMVENDPQEFIKSLERTNPGAGENFLDKLSKLYVDRYARADADTTDSKKDDASKPNAELESRIRELSERVEGFQTQAQQAAASAAQAQVKARYTARVDDLFGQLPADKVPLTDYEKGLIRKALSADLADDPNAVKRVYNGNFVDVPRQFKSIVEGFVNDRKAAVEADKAKREKAASTAFPEFGAGPVELPKDFYDVSNVPTDNLWDEGPLVRILEGTR